MEFLECRGASKRFAGGVRAVDGIDLVVKEREFLTILGPSGSGKSTLLRLIAGLETPTEGEIFIRGRNAAELSPRERDAALVFQTPALFPHLTVFDNLAFGLKAHRLGKGEIRLRVEEAAELLGIADLLKRKPSRLSGGQRQRVALGRAIARKPALLLLDEPLSNLDPPLRASIRADLQSLRRRSPSTFIFVTHDQAEALALGDRVALVHRGRIEQIGAPRELLEQPASLFAASFVGNPPANAFPVVLEPEGELGWIRFEEFDHRFEAPRDLPAGPLTLALKPESISEDVSGVLRGEIIGLEPIGHETVALVSLGARTLRMRLPGFETRAIGETIGLRFNRSDALWFSRESGRRIAPGS